MTNYCEEQGYEVKLVRLKNNFRCDVYFKEKLIKSGEKLFSGCLEAQKESYTKIYNAIT